MSEPLLSRQDGLQISPITDPADFLGAFDVCARAFGEQIHDNIWIALSPSWDTPQGRAAGGKRLEDQWRSATTDRDGNKTVYPLKATLPSPHEPSHRVVAGVAVFVQLSAVQGRGDPATTEVAPTREALLEMFGGDERAARLGAQLRASLVGRRVEAVRAKAEEGAEPPAVFVLDLCAVDPAFQRRGIALELVRLGLEEAERRGGLEATTEASVMGRHVYRKLGFKNVAEIEYEVDEELVEGKVFPSNLFMRTGK